MGKRKSNKPKAKPARTAPSGPQEKRRPMLSKRRFIQLLIAIPAGGAAGAAIHHHDVKRRTLHNLSVLGTGQPVVVQIHDPSCSQCRRLMANVKNALKENADIVYRVADVSSRKGAAFQAQYNVPNVTLLLFSASGQHVGTLRGVTPVTDLVAAFNSLAEAA